MEWNRLCLRIGRLAARVLRLAIAVSFGYLLVLGMNAFYESHPAVLAFMMKALPFVLPLLVFGLLTYHVVQGTRAFREGMREAQKCSPDRHVANVVRGADVQHDRGR